MRLRPRLLGDALPGRTDVVRAADVLEVLVQGGQVQPERDEGRMDAPPRVPASRERLVERVPEVRQPELHRPLRAFARRVGADCFFTTLGTDQPAVPVERAQLTDTVDGEPVRVTLYTAETSP